MRTAISGSALAHAAIFGTALLGFAWPVDDAAAPGVVTVDIIPIDTVSSNQQASMPSSAAQDQVSSGRTAASGSTAEPVVPETLAPLPAARIAPAPVEPLQPIAPPTAVSVLAAPAATPLIADEVVATAPTALPSVPAVPAIPVAPPPIEPISVADAVIAPVPHRLSQPRPSTPTPRPQAPQQKTAAPAAARQAGNGGTNNADSAASQATAGQQGGAGGGGTAEIAAWERQVRRALASARRYPRSANGAAGEAIVRFSVSAAGTLLDLRIFASSGSSVLDEAARDTVNRAAPFPPLPNGAGITSKTVQVPLAFVRD